LLALDIKFNYKKVFKTMKTLQVKNIEVLPSSQSGIMGRDQSDYYSDDAT